MGWQVRRPDGVTIELEEDQWSDSWQLDPAGPPPGGGEPPELPPVEALLSRSTQLRHEFLQTGDLSALEESLRVARAAVERTREPSPLRPIALNVAAASAQDWYWATGDVDVLREAADYAQLVLDDPFAVDANRGKDLNTLAAVHQNLYAATGEQAELAYAIEVGREAIGAAREPDDWSISATNVVGALDDWYELTQERDALDEALELARRVVEQTPEDHPRRPGRLNTYGNVLMSWFGETSEASVLNRAISVRREALRLADPDEVDYASILNNLGNALHVRARLEDDLDALREAVDLRREAVAHTPAQGIARVAHLKNLVTALGEWREASGDGSVDDELERTVREIEALDPDERPPPAERTTMSGIPRELAYAFAANTKWKKAFLAIADDSPIRLAGLAESIRVTTFDKKSDFVYYVVTQQGLHVGQQSSGGFLGGKSYVDHFLARDDIVGLDTDFINTIQFDARDGSRVILWLHDASGQLGPQGMARVPAVAQMEALATALGWRYDRQPAPEISE